MERDDTISVAMATLRSDIEDAGYDGEPRHTIMPPEFAKRLGVERGLEMGRTLGEGGMGIVRLARQTALARNVAVKTLRGTITSEVLARRLLQEAWTTGALEHPNIVPVYDIQVDEQDRPVIVLKRIEGREWCELMTDGSAIKRSFGASDPLEWNLRILMRVCRALHFAHRRGFVHRDIKPENVMIGEFGEVYVLDWGIAVRTRDDGSDRFALASEAHALAGTPAYMAPEMLGGEAPDLGPWTDIYLVGAVLYELITGQAPHQGTRLQDILRSVISGPPPIEKGQISSELIRICERAMDRDRSARFENVEQFRLALEGFLKHRGARHLADEAERSFAAMKVAIEEGDELKADAALVECRFGFRAASAAWPGFDQAKTRLRDAELTMARAELKAGHPKAADRLLGHGDSVPPELREAVDVALAEHRQEQEDVVRWRTAASEDTGRRTRTFLLGLMTTGWVIGPLLRHFFYTDAALSVGAPVVTSAIMLAILVWARDSMQRSHLNRIVGSAVAAVAFITPTLAMMGYLAGRDQIWMEQTAPLVWLAATLFVTFAGTKSAWPSAVAMTVTAFVVQLFPEWRNEASAAGNAVLFFNAMWINRADQVLSETLRERSDKRRSKMPKPE